MSSTLISRAKNPRFFGFRAFFFAFEAEAADLGCCRLVGVVLPCWPFLLGGKLPLLVFIIHLVPFHSTGVEADHFVIT